MMNYPDDADKLQAKEWARGILQDASAVILDTETTGLYGEAVEIAVINLQCETLFNQRVKPLGEIDPVAERVHGITLKSLENAPTFDLIYSQLQSVLNDKYVLIYNHQFDSRILRNQCASYKLQPVNLMGDCVMLWYSQWVGDWNDYHGNYRWQKLPSGDHSALGDCLATLKVIKEMAGIEEIANDQDDSL